MRHRNKRTPAIVSALIVSLAAAAVYAQQQAKKPAAANPEDIGQVFRVDTRRVICNTTVVDRSGHLVTDLKQNNFNVAENGTPQVITEFKHEDVPVSMGLVIDNSGSMRDKRAKVAAAALA